MVDDSLYAPTNLNTLKTFENNIEDQFKLKSNRNMTKYLDVQHHLPELEAGDSISTQIKQKHEKKATKKRGSGDALKNLFILCLLMVFSDQ